METKIGEFIKYCEDNFYFDKAGYKLPLDEKIMIIKKKPMNILAIMVGN
jgi:hypothetical protein